MTITLEFTVADRPGEIAVSTMQTPGTFSMERRNLIIYVHPDDIYHFLSLQKHFDQDPLDIAFDYARKNVMHFIDHACATRFKPDIQFKFQAIDNFSKYINELMEGVSRAMAIPEAEVKAHFDGILKRNLICRP